jgi:tetratricopeptide (TPR) repeat protein
MREGEGAFVRGDLDGALKDYQRAFQLDPKLYEAALFAGDMYFKKGHLEADPRKKGELMERAGEWFARAVAIDENRETAHRYWGDALAAVNKMEEARAKFIEAIIAEPYSRRAWVGLTQWAQWNSVELSHPLVETPKQGGDAVWAPYASTRAVWRGKRFAETFPGERAYRHSLAEEAAALRAVAEAASKVTWSGEQPALSPSLSNLLKLSREGLLEAYVLFALADEGIAQDYASYRQASRDKLRRYLTEYVASGKD